MRIRSFDVSKIVPEYRFSRPGKSLKILRRSKIRFQMQTLIGTKGLMPWVWDFFHKISCCIWSIVPVWNFFSYFFQLKKIRSLVIAGATQYEEFYVALRNLDLPLQGTIKDLRSQVVREACVTISYLSQTLGNRFDKTAEVLLQHLINLIQNSAKVSGGFLFLLN